MSKEILAVIDRFGEYKRGAELSDVQSYLAEKGLVAVNLEDLKRAEFMLGWNGSYDVTAEILNEMVYKIESAKGDL